ncbi:putative Zn-dependent peptidase [Galbibacter orientalis DSM 19592]|uniref:Putative Zn-dependent peptidase n=1 Tax=Galbibacter orientalis DSM 19592 TaxID=926559 RepID=I3C512_9FLAO|nr:pitrilysin family protein [Galbibacter orientalis]EIJ38705.1 putative Zn-dependent peptidase [Galbibacter orientalis DSM 19592]
MKTKILSILLLFCVGFTFAQIDRSKQPAPGPAPTINLEEPETFVLENGLTVMVVENHKLPRVSVTLTIDNSPVLEGKKAGVSQLAGDIMGSGTTSIGKDEYNERIDFLGANINFGSQSAYASCLSKYFPEILSLMADGALNPVFSQEEFDKKKKQLEEGIKSSENDVSSIASRVTNALSYGKNHPYGEFISEETLNNVSLEDATNFYNTYFKPEKAYLVIVGDVKPLEVEKLVRDNFSSWKKDSAPGVTYGAPRNVQYTQIDFIDMPNAVQSEIKVRNMIDLKMSDKDYHAALIANHIFGGSFNSYLNMNLREAHGYTYGARSYLDTDEYNASNFSASTSVRNAVTDSAVVEFMKEIKRIRTEPVSAEDLVNAKAKYVGDFVIALENPRTIARYALNIKTRNLPDDFYVNYLEKINAVTVEDVQRVANKYFKADNARIVVTGKGSEVADKLEALNYPVTYYDKEANKIEKPNYNVAIPKDVTAESVLNKYIEAIGGKDKVSALNSISFTYEGSFNGATIKAEEKRTANKYAQTTYMNGSPMMAVVANETEVFMKQGGNKVPLPPAMVNDMKNAVGIFPELTLLTNDAVKVVGIEKVEGKDAYKVEVPGEAVQAFYFYDTESGLKVKELAVINMGGQTQNQEALLLDYKDYEGIKFPSVKKAALGGQTVESTLTEVIINPELTEADFE